jgi:hypothetical protein
MTMTLTRLIFPAAILLGFASAAVAMSPTGQNYRPYAHAYASARAATAPAAPRTAGVTATQAELADHQSSYYRN